MEITGLYYSKDIRFYETSDFDHKVFDTGKVFYEVLRIINGTALFLDDHLHRLQTSIQLAGCSFQVSVSLFHYLLRNLINRNNTANGNVRIMVHFMNGESLPLIYTFFIPHNYPDAEMYEKGVVTSLFKAERIDPNVKMDYPEMSRKISEFIKSHGIYDVLLVDKDNNITEGSRTNVFFVRNDELFTPPSEKVLKGITRLKVIQLCNKLNLKITEQIIPASLLKDYEAAFFTGTSPKVLPVNRIDDMEFSTDNRLVKAVIKAYDELVSDYLQNN